MFGLLDDVAVFSKALTQIEITNIINQKRINGNENALLIAWCFDTPGQGEEPLLLNLIHFGKRVKGMDMIHWLH